MNKFLKYGIFSIWCVVLLTIVSVSESSAQDPTREILKRMDTHNKALQTLTAGVTMVKHDATLKVSDTLIGKTSYLPKQTKGKMAFRLDWQTENGRPMEESMSVIGDEAKLYQPRQKLLKVGKTQKSKSSKGLGSALSFLSMSRTEIANNYSIVYLGDEQIKTGERTWHLQLTPKGPASYKTAEIWVDANGMPRQFKINEENNDYTGVLLSDVKKNERLDLGIFEIQVPAGTSKQKF